MERSGKVLDMTRGKPVRMILAFAIPLLIGNVFQQVYSMADTMVAGYCLGDRAIAAIGAMSALYSLIISVARQLVILLPAAWLLIRITGSIYAVWWCFPIAELAALFISLYFYRQCNRKMIAVL